MGIEQIQPTFGASDYGVQAKLRELILYIADRSVDDPKFGATKLNKILYYSDFLSYRRRNRSITGAEYRKRQHGPAPHAMKIVCREMVESEDAIEQPRGYYGRPQKRLVARRRPRLDEHFKAEDIAIVDAVMEMLKDDDARSVSKRSHDIRYRIADMDERIPYQSAFLSDRKLSPEDIEWAQVEIEEDRKHGPEDSADPRVRIPPAPFFT